MNLDDKSLFLDAMEDVQPLKRATDGLAVMDHLKSPCTQGFIVIAE